MAKNKPVAATATETNGDATAAGATAAPASTKPRKERNDAETIYWNRDRDTALIREIMSAPGQLTTKRLAEKLQTDPAFADDPTPLKSESAPEKIRQRVNKLSALSVKRGHPALELRRMNNSGYDPTDVLDEIFGQGQTSGVGVAPAALPTPNIPVQAQPQFVGGLIPT